MESTNSTFTNIEKQMLALAFISDVEANRDIIVHKTFLNKKKYKNYISFQEIAAEKAIKKLLSWEYNEATHKFLKGWELMYGPVISETKKGGTVANTSTSIYYHKDTEHMVIGVAGTNPISTYGWFTEDFEVGTTVSWNKNIVTEGPNNGSGATGPIVSEGTAIALMNTWNTKSSQNNLTVVQWLKANLSTYSTDTLSVTGHSLGGAISPALALALYENQDKWREKTKSKIKIQSYIYAGPTPGNQEFYKLFNTNPNITSDKVFVTSIRNGNDVVPHAWDIRMMKELPSLFSNPKLPGMEVPAEKGNKGALVYWTIQYLIGQSNKAGKDFYKRWSNEKVFTTILPTSSFASRAQFNSPAIIATYDLVTTKNGTPVTAAGKVAKYDMGKFFEKVENISGVTGDEKIEPYLVYLFEFLSILANQHGVQYYDHVIDNVKVKEEIHEIFKTPNTTSEFKAEKGFSVLSELIKKVDIYKNLPQSNNN
jgi:hypothetical protein